MTIRIRSSEQGDLITAQVVTEHDDGTVTVDGYFQMPTARWASAPWLRIREAITDANTTPHAQRDAAGIT